MQRDLAGFGPTVSRDPFHVDGWTGAPATVPAFNVEVTVPGVAHPEQEVVIGCHYDGEADSTQSANDDASGCAIELGVAKALGNYWRAHRVYPARTIRFVIFDAEEQGLFGSYHYVNQTINGDTNTITAMFNEEQNGIAYPLRYLGKTSNPVLPLFAYTSPLQSDPNLYPNLNHTASQSAAINNFDALMREAVPNVFARFQQLGFATLAYHDDNGRPVDQQVFAQSQLNAVQQAPDTLGSSDQMPFTMAGLPCVTIVGNSTYYDSDPPPWSYPFDQPQDTIQMMNTFANDTASKAPALTLSLALPAMLTTWMLQQPSIMGVVSADGAPIAAISDIGQTIVGQPLALDANATYDPANSGATFNYTWDFGDGASAQGVTVNHTYKSAGTYRLTLTVREASGARRVIHKTLHVATKAPSYTNPYAAFPSNGTPPNNPAVTLPTPGA
ncbi:MAG TPA: M28 family peptidase, partial [Ktedonobacterales bacterium]|nr:M28 family peptidase [Ktedonobacterales bacterium]